jgi:uncharacterized protein
VDARSRQPTYNLWRRLDVPGHDAARLVHESRGAELSGFAVFADEGVPAALHYEVHCDATWHTTEAHVQGWHGAAPVDLQITRDNADRWALNEIPCPSVTGCVDLDLSFTPATNLLPLRRLRLAVNQAAEVHSAWLQWPSLVLTLLVQRYRRRSIDEYDYEADLPGASRFTAVLRVDPNHWVLDYGGLWQTEMQ